MPSPHTILLVGGTGRTGRCVLQLLLDGGSKVRVIVRSAKRLPEDAAGHSNLTVLEADLLSLGDAELQRQVCGCDAVISCLGHVISFRGIFGHPRDLVTRATTRLCRTIQAQQFARPVRLVLMSSVSVSRPGGLDTRRGMFERAFMRVLCRLLPPAQDNQRAADFLWRDIGTTDAFVQWAAVRPDTLLKGEVAEYAIHDGLVSGLFAPASTNIASVAHFMCELATNEKTWDDWRGKLPVIINSASP